MAPDYIDVHKNEPILATCPFCHLPIYQSDPHNMVSPAGGGRSRPYHRGCNLTMKGHDLEADLSNTISQLRSLGYEVNVMVKRPEGMA